MLYLAGENSELDITMYVNSPGGSVSAGMAIYDTMQFIPCDVKTVCFGLAASMGSFLLAAGTRGKRTALPNSRIMIHQPLGGAQGPAADVLLQAKEILFLREILNMHLADMTGKTTEQIKEDCDRDNFMTPEEAKVYGLIDDIVPTKSWPRLTKPARPDLFD
uniref:ATP-dependent Clp protease proteolytic subunit n=1 Tax=Spumella elongata TaxID=89044 RepID=A0A7S3HAF2_9STRA|mmetsp:Transcript_42365/g.73660  ORF Transcript_42365/g.73660 Transcript_42365/m.73660 type:complete len:162 (+) Transcript_42365:2-487(+)